MKTETQIAKENIRKIKEFMSQVTGSIERFEFINRSKEHKASCERFLEFLELGKTKGKRFIFNYLDKCKNCEFNESLINDKITDLKQVIKLYSENGI